MYIVRVCDKQQKQNRSLGLSQSCKWTALSDKQNTTKQGSGRPTLSVNVINSLVFTIHTNTRGKDPW